MEQLTSRVALPAIDIENRPSCITIRDDSIGLPAIWGSVLQNTKRRPTL